MDRNYYYRVLGVRSDATPAQIKAAYDARMARLSSADYDDEPEYARRKKEQATNAYRVLMGVSPVATKEAKASRFEKHKDRIEKREGFKINIGKRAIKNTSDKAKLSVAGTTITILIAIIGLFSSLGDLTADERYEYEDFYYITEIEAAEEIAPYFDYDVALDYSTVALEAENVDWDEGVEVYISDYEDFSDLRYGMMQVANSIGIYDLEELLYYATGDYDFYSWNDDYDCATELIYWLGAPSFEDVAGAMNLYTDKPILSLTDYMGFLEAYYYEHY